MQDRTPQIAAAGHRGTMYTGNYASLILRTVRKEPRGITVDGLLGSLGLLSTRDQTFPEFEEAMAELMDLGLIGSKEYDALPEDGKRLELKQVWRVR